MNKHQSVELLKEKATVDEARAERLLRLRDVLARVGVSRSTLYAWIKEGKFPAPIRISDSISAWPASDVDAWVLARIRAARSEGAK